MAKKKTKRSDLPEDAILLVKNKRAYHDYQVVERIEAGLVLLGSEVKSLRDRRASLEEGHVEVRGGEAWLVGARINEYPWANRLNHEPSRRRKLLLHKREIKKLEVKTAQRGFAAIPLVLYLRNGRIKLLLGVGRGRRHYEKREAKKEQSAQREIDRALRK